MVSVFPVGSPDSLNAFSTRFLSSLFWANIRTMLRNNTNTINNGNNNVKIHENL